MLAAKPYLGRDELRPVNVQLGEHVVCTLMENFFNRGHNVTCDNFFTSLRLLQRLKQMKTSIVGTVRHNRRELPPIVHSKLPLYQSKILQNDGNSLTIYQSKKDKKPVIVLSSLHPNVEISSDHKHKPETILFYNSTKYGVDALDQMCKMYTVKLPSRRWRMNVSSNMLDLAVINSWILYKKTSGKTILRRDFINDLAEQLVSKPCDNSLGEQENVTKKRKTCHVGCCKRNQTSNSCLYCGLPCCGNCSIQQFISLKCDSNH